MDYWPRIESIGEASHIETYNMVCLYYSLYFIRFIPFNISRLIFELQNLCDGLNI